MNIYEAFKAAGPSGRVCRQLDYDIDHGDFYFRSKDMKSCSQISVFYHHGQELSPNWEPCFDDLVAEDWIVLKENSADDVNPKKQQPEKIAAFKKYFAKCSYCRHWVHTGNYCEQCGHKLIPVN